MARPGRVLVAEDDDDDVVLLQRAFAKAGVNAQVDYVADGQKVIDYLLAKPPYQNQVGARLPDVLLLDLKMPRVSGFDVLQWLAEHPAYRPGQVVVLSASEIPEDIKRANTLHADHYLVKPHEPAELILMVKLLEPYWQDRGAREESSAAA